MDIKEILKSGDIGEGKTDFDKVLDKLCVERHKKLDIEQYTKEYGTQHEILNKKDKRIITESQPKQERTVPTQKLVVPMQRKIVAFASGYLFGEPVKYVLNDDAYQEQYNAMDRIFRENKINYFNRKMARIVLSETHAAEYWFPVKRNGKTLIRVALWAKSSGDDLYPHFDDTGDMDAFVRRYELEKKSHADVYMADKTLKAVRDTESQQWEVAEEPNPIGKIRVIYYEKEYPEWYFVQKLIDRVEWLISSHADVNDYYGDPMLKVFGNYEGGIVKAEDGKAIFFTQTGSDQSGKPIYGDAEYVTWESMPESKKMELENLLDLIHSMTSTPDLSFGSVKGIGNISGITIRMMMMDAKLKGLMNQEVFGEGLMRRFNLLKAMMAPLKMAKGDVAGMEADVAFADPLPVDYTEMMDALTVATGGDKILSQETAVQLNPFVRDAPAEVEKIKAAQKEAEAKETYQPVEAFVQDQPFEQPV